MSFEFILPLNDARSTLETVGGKGLSLSKLITAGLQVPDGFHITTAAYRRFVEENGLQPQVEDALQQVHPEKPATLENAASKIRQAFMEAAVPGDIAAAIVGAYGDLAGTDPTVAVRSSATAEDLPEASFAGQQETYLNVCGADHVLEAVKKCWSSLWTGRAIGYRLRQEVDPSGVALAVVVQRLVKADVSGILFTVSPIGKGQEHMMINASWGLGDAVVGGRVTPDEYVVRKSDGRTVDRQIADKEIMTASTDGGVEDQSVPENLRRVPVLEKADLAELCRLGVEIESLYGMPMDIEWTLADGKFHIVQARPITALQEQAISPADEWPLPKPEGRYMRASIVDLMPDPLSPLFATMGIRAYNAMLGSGIEDLLGSKKQFLPSDLILTIRNYAYMTVNFTAREWWGMLSVLAPKMPRLIREGPEHFHKFALPGYAEKVKRLEGKPLATMTAEELWLDAKDLIAAAFYHLSVLQVDTLGAAAGSEGLFTAIYGRFFRREGDPVAPIFLMGYDTQPVRSEKSLYDLAQWARGQPDLSAWLLDTPAREIADSRGRTEAPPGIDAEAWLEWQRRLEAHLEAFGHTFYDLDFVKPVPADDPTPLLETAKMYIRGEGQDPHTRHRRLKEARETAERNLLARARGLRGWAVRKSLGWAQSLSQVREDSVASIGLAYPRLRALLKELGRRMVSAGAIDQEEDIFWLQEVEVEGMLASLQASRPLPSMTDEVKARKSDLEQSMKLMPPAQLPPSDTYLGIPIQAFIPGEGGHEGDRLKGVGASAGHVTGIACVLHGPEDFDQMRQGGILVAKMTTPAWTPLFAMASAIVTDIGGPLSHGSIVAREYGIPAVLGTAAATRVIESGQQITVDGDSGYVTLVDVPDR